MRHVLAREVVARRRCRSRRARAPGSTRRARAPSCSTRTVAPPRDGWSMRVAAGGGGGALCRVCDAHAGRFCPRYLGSYRPAAWTSASSGSGSWARAWPRTCAPPATTSPSGTARREGRGASASPVAATPAEAAARRRRRDHDGRRRRAGRGGAARRGRRPPAAPDGRAVRRHVDDRPADARARAERLGPSAACASSTRRSPARRPRPRTGR